MLGFLDFVSAGNSARVVTVGFLNEATLNAKLGHLGIIGEIRATCQRKEGKIRGRTLGRISPPFHSTLFGISGCGEVVKEHSGVTRNWGYATPFGATNRDFFQVTRLAAIAARKRIKVRTQILRRAREAFKNFVTFVPMLVSWHVTNRATRARALRQSLAHPLIAHVIMTGFPERRARTTTKSALQGRIGDLPI